MMAQHLYLALVVVAFATFAGTLFAASLVANGRPAAAQRSTQRIVHRAARPNHPLAELGHHPAIY